VRSIAITLTALFLAACGSPRPAARPTSMGPPRGPSIDPTATVADAPPVPAPPPHNDVVTVLVEPLKEVACELHATWSGDLALRPRGPVFAHVASGETALALPLDPKREPLFTVDSSVVVHGFVDDAPLFLGRAFALGGFVAPSSRTRVDVEPLGEGRLRVSVDASAVLEEPKRAASELPCDALTFAPVHYDGVDVPKNATEGSLRPSAPLSLVPGGPPVATLRATASRVMLGPPSHGARPVWIQPGPFVVFGWIPTASVAEDGFHGMGHVVAPGVAMGYGSRSVDHPSSCAHDLVLFAEAGGERADVGLLRARTSFTFEPAETGDDPAFRAVDLLSRRVHAAHGARFEVRRADLEDCAADR
jgi:hypothetical protein